MKRLLSRMIILLALLPLCAASAELDSTQDSYVTTYGTDIEFVLEPIGAFTAFFQLETQIFHQPSPLWIDGKAYLTYEIFISNVGNQSFKLSRVDVLNNDDSNKVLFSYNEDQLLEMIKSYHLTDSDSEQSLVLKPGIRAVLFFMPEFRRQRDIPHKLIHRFVMQKVNKKNSEDLSAQPFFMNAAIVNANMSAPVIFGAPLHGEHWLAANGPSNTSVHRRVRITNHGVMYFPERFAIDFTQFGQDGKMYKEDSSKNENYYGYGANVYSVATGRVFAVIEGIPDNIPGRHDYPINLSNINGNYVLIDIGHKHYAFYAHLKPDSIKVKRGDIVQKGQVIGLLGNSGNSTAPHLHFHIGNEPSGVSTQGIPYAFEHLTTENYKAPNPDADEPHVIFSKNRVLHNNQLVHENDMVNFEAK